MTSSIHEQVLRTARQMAATGLTSGTAGNVSARLDPWRADASGRVVITPSAVRYDEMGVDDLVVLDATGAVPAGGRAPSSELLLHLACYRAFPEVGAVVHTHPVYATMFACARRPIPALVDEALLYIGGEVAVADYAISGSAELGDNAVRRLADVGSALLANHGMVTVAADPAAALHQADLVERCARVAVGARALGPPVEVPPAARAELGARYRSARRAGQPNRPVM